jgi:Icc-related predicted phosphoesterase
MEPYDVKVLNWFVGTSGLISPGCRLHENHALIKALQSGLRPENFILFTGLDFYPKNLVIWYGGKDFQFFKELVMVEDPKRLHNCLDSLEKLTWADLRFRSNPCNDFNSDAPYLLQMLIDKGVHFDDVSRPKKIEFLHLLYYKVGIDEESFNNYRAFWV